MPKKLLFISIIGLISFFSCKKKDFSLNSEYEDVTIVYGILNPSDTVHYLKIYKSFLTDGNAFDAAKNIDNYSYIDSIDVKIEEYNGSQLLQTIVFDTTTSIPKDSGTFAYPLQILYKAHAQLNRAYTYKIIIKNRYTQKTTTAVTGLVGEVSIKIPVYYIGRRNNITFIPHLQQLEFVKGDNIALTQASFYLHYSNVYKDLQRKQGEPVIWDVGESKTNRISYVGENLLRRMKEEIPIDEEVDYRLIDSIVVHLYTASNDLYLYNIAISASTGLNQERLEYTNLKSQSWVDGEWVEDKNALGVFASRGHYTLMYDEFSRNTNDSLLRGRFTKHLKFRTYDY